MKLAAARLFVRDLEEARAFYEQKLALRVRAASTEAGYLVFETQSCDLIVERVSPDAPHEELALVGRFSGLSFSVPNIESLCEELAARGVRFTGLPQRQPWGGTLATLLDPAGNELQLVQYPGADQP